MRLWLAAGAVAVLSIVACGSAPGGATPVVSPPTSALVPWQGFPAGKHPRPIVWLGNASPVNGFLTGDAKIAFYCNKFTLGSPLPKNLPSLAVATWSDATRVTYAGISAADALAAITRSASGMSASDCAAVAPLVVSAARLGTFDFDTDRGKAQMTAWLFTVSGASGEVAYPALAPTAFWSGGLSAQSSNGGAGLSPDGRSLTFTFYGSPDVPGPCGADYKGVVAESSTAVAVAVQEISHAGPDDVACPAIAQERSVTVILASPLGGRVVVDASGDAVTVCPEASAKAC
jgi:hypothetical protein